MSVGPPHQAREQRAGLAVPIHPKSVGAPAGPRRLERRPGLGPMDQLDGATRHDRLQEGVRGGHREVEVCELTRGVLGLDEALDVGMVRPEHRHLGAAAGPGGLQGLARAVEEAHEGDGAAGERCGAVDQGPLGPERGEVQADTAPPPEGLRGLLECRIDARDLAVPAPDAVAQGLHEAVDQGGLEAGPRRCIDPAAGDEARPLGRVEHALPVVPIRLAGGQGPCHAPTHTIQVPLPRGGVLAPQGIHGDGLGAEPRLRPVGIRHGPSPGIDRGSAPRSRCTRSPARVRPNSAGR